MCTMRQQQQLFCINHRATLKYRVRCVQHRNAPIMQQEWLSDASRSGRGVINEPRVAVGPTPRPRTEHQC
jgi:hypothetical protein